MSAGGRVNMAPDAFFHFRHLFFHAFHQFKLGARPVEVVAVLFRFKVNVPFQIVCQEADAGFQRDEQAGKGEVGNFQRRDEVPDGVQIAPDDGFKHGHAQEGFVQVLFIFRRGGSHGAHHVSEVVQDAAGHYCVQVNDADGLVRFPVQHHIVDFSVVMDDSDGQLSLFLKVQKDVHVMLAAADEFQLPPAGVQPPVGVFGGCFFQSVKASAGMVEERNGFMDVLRIHIAQKLLEGAEGAGGFISLAWVFRHVKRMGAFNAVVAAPETGTGDFQVFAAAPGGVQVQRLAEGSLQHPEHFPADVVGHLLHIVHHVPGALEDGVIDALEDVAVRGAVCLPVGGPEGHVDMAAVDGVAMEEFSGNGEGVTQGGNLFLKGIGMENGGQRHGRKRKQTPGACGKAPGAEGMVKGC